MTDDPLPDIIRDLALPVVRNNRRLRGVELAPHVRSLRQLLEEVWEEHDLAERDWSLRGDRDKPRRELAKNKRVASPYDYSAFLQPDHDARYQREWDAHYASTYARPASNPRVGRDNGLPLIPLDCVYRLLRQWWLAHGLRWAWRPEYRVDENAAQRLEYMNPPLRLLYLVARSCGPDYSVANCLAVHDHLRSPARVANKAAKDRVARKKAAKPRASQKTR